MSRFPYVLQLQTPSGDGAEYSVLKPELTLGRRPENDLILEDVKVSGQHARLLFTPESPRVLDLDSRNGVYLNGQRVPPRVPTPFRFGDTLTIGPFALRVRVATPDAPAPPASEWPLKLSAQQRPPANLAQVCAQCDAPLHAGAHFCAHCGAMVNAASPAQHSDRSPVLVVIRPGQSPAEYPLERPALHLGRGPENDIVLNDSILSAQHLRIEVNGRDVRVIDLGSTNGTQLNGRFIPPHTPRALQPDDVIRIGNPQGNSLSLRLKRRQATSLRMQPLGMQALAQHARIVIGRAAECQMTLEHPTVSRRHAEIARQSAGYAIRDLESVNGTFVNGARVEDWRALHTGDVIHIGPFRLVYDGHTQKLSTAVTRGHRLDTVRLGKQVQGGHMILNDVSIAVHGGEFVALVGGSGAGKSTLIKAMNGFSPATHGRMLIDGDDLYANLEAYRTLMAYVPQDDIIHKQLPVRLALWYAAKLRLPDATNPEIEQRVAEVLQLVDMTAHADKPVYVLSGGQRKRVSIAAELLSQPELLFLDEPTSGLDPGLEKKMMYDLNRLADQGRTVVLVTHATTNIEQCDHVAFLTQGRLAYYGPPSDAIDYFKARDFADIYLKLSQDAEPTAWAKQYRRSPICRRYVRERQAPLKTLQPPAQNAPVQRPRPARDSALRQIGVLARRHLDLIRHDWITLFILLIMMPIISLLFMTVSDKHDLTGWQMTQAQVDARLIAQLATTGEEKAEYMPVQAATQLLTMLGLALTQAGAFGAAFEIVKERSIFLRERSINLQPGAYVVSKILVLGLFAVIQVASSLFILSLKVSLDFAPILDFFPNGGMELLVTLLLGVIASIMLGLFISAMVPTPDIVLYIILGQLFAQIILSGALFPLPDNFASKLVISHWTMDAMGSTVNVLQLNEEGRACSTSEYGEVCTSIVSAPEKLGLNYAHTSDHLLTTWAALLVQTCFWGVLTMIVQTQRRVT